MELKRVSQNRAVLLAAKNGNKKALEAAIAEGGYIDSRDEVLATPLHYTALRGDQVCAKILLVAGADVNALDRDGNTPLDLAYEESMRAFLRASGGRASNKPEGEIQAKDSARWTGQTANGRDSTKSPHRS